MTSLYKNLRLARHGANYINHRFGALLKPHLGFNSESTVRPRLAVRAFHHSIITRYESQETGDTKPLERETGIPPAHFLVEIDSLLVQSPAKDKFETREFKAGGYKWKLIINPNGCRRSYVSVTLALADTSALPPNWEFNAVFLIFLGHEDGYYNSVLGRARFHATKTETCIQDFISQYDLEIGHIVDDKCVFGAEVFVNENNATTEYVCLNDFKAPPHKRSFEIPKFPSLKDGWLVQKTWTSEVFIACGNKWKIRVRPNGLEDSTGRLSILLERVACCYDKSLENVKASYTVCLKNQFSDEHSVKKTSSSGDGWQSLIDLASLNDPAKGFIVNDCVRLQLELSLENV